MLGIKTIASIKKVFLLNLIIPHLYLLEEQPRLMNICLVITIVIRTSKNMILLKSKTFTPAKIYFLQPTKNQI